MTALAWSDQPIRHQQFFKYFNMTGWRLGWMVAPSRAIYASSETRAESLHLPSTPAQYAALAAFSPATIAIAEERREAFAERRNFLLRALREIGFDLPVAPDGAFYLYAGCSCFSEDSHRFAIDLLEATGVAITPGLDFGANHPERHVRIAYDGPSILNRPSAIRLRRYALITNPRVGVVAPIDRRWRPYGPQR